MPNIINSNYFFDNCDSIHSFQVWMNTNNIVWYVQEIGEGRHSPLLCQCFSNFHHSSGFVCFCIFVVNWGNINMSVRFSHILYTAHFFKLKDLHVHTIFGNKSDFTIIMGHLTLYLISNAISDIYKCIWTCILDEL